MVDKDTKASATEDMRDLALVVEIQVDTAISVAAAAAAVAAGNPSHLTRVIIIMKQSRPSK